MIEVIVQLGHCYRTRGSTGTSGHRGTEQEFVSLVGHAMKSFLHTRGVTCETVLADERIPDCEVFVALHQDGSTNIAARGASVGYPTSNNNSARLGATWKAMYQLAGWPSGFRPDNYTSALSGYYGFRRVNATTKLLIEHGFATNRSDEDWMWDRIGLIAETNSRAIMHHLGVAPLTPTKGTPDMGVRLEVHSDPNAKKTWAMYGPIDKPICDLYSTHLEGAGEESPNGYYIVRDAIAAGRMEQVGDQKFT